MQLRVKLFGTLSGRVQGYDPEHGLEVVLPDGARVRDLMDRLEIDAAELNVVTVDGKILKPDAELKDGVCAHVIPAVFGG